MSIQCLPPREVPDTFSRGRPRGLDPNDSDVMRLAVNRFSFIALDGVDRNVSLQEFACADGEMSRRAISKREFCNLVGAENLYTTSESLINEYRESFSSPPEVICITIASVYSTRLINFGNNKPCALVHSVYLSIPFTVPSQPFFREYTIPEQLFLSIPISNYNELVESRGIGKEFML